jgi:hypothetical protein
MSVYKFVKRSGSSASSTADHHHHYSSHGGGPVSKRLFLQGVRDENDADHLPSYAENHHQQRHQEVQQHMYDGHNVTAVYTHRNLSTELHSSTVESNSRERRGPMKSVTTRTVKKTTTLTRGQQLTQADELYRQQQQREAAQLQRPLRAIAGAKVSCWDVVCCGDRTRDAV